MWRREVRAACWARQVDEEGPAKEAEREPPRIYRTARRRGALGAKRTGSRMGPEVADRTCTKRYKT